MIDGDTIELRNGNRVRLVQIDAPEAGEGEVLRARSTEALRGTRRSAPRYASLPTRSSTSATASGACSDYVFEGKTNVNLALVRQGAASVWFVEGDRGRYANRLLRTAEAAQEGEVGLWERAPAPSSTRYTVRRRAVASPSSTPRGCRSRPYPSPITCCTHDPEGRSLAAAPSSTEMVGLSGAVVRLGRPSVMPLTLRIRIPRVLHGFLFGRDAAPTSVIGGRPADLAELDSQLRRLEQQVSICRRRRPSCRGI